MASWWRQRVRSTAELRWLVDEGEITEDDTMSTLFARYGREHVESQMRKLFGDKLKSAGGEGVLSLEGYLRVVGVRQPRQPQVTQAPPSTAVGAGK